MVLDDQRFKDHCLIIVGNGGKADEVLAKRRLEAVLALITMQNVHCNQIPHGQDGVRFGYAIKSISCHSQYCFLWICLYSTLYASLSQLLRKNPNQTYIIFG